MNDNNSTPIYSKQVLEFVAVVTEWCNLVELTDNFNKREFIDKLHKLSAFVYQKATILPKTEQIYGDVEKFVTEIDWTLINNKAEAKLVSNNDFVEIPEIESYQIDTGAELNLAEIIADIYQSLKDFIMLYQVGNEESMNDALWEIKDEFGRYWGIRLNVLVQSLHKLLYNGQELIDEELQEDKKEKFDKNDSWVSQKWDK